MIKIIVNILVNIFVPYSLNHIKLKIFNVNAHPYNIIVVNIKIYFIYSAP